MNVFESFTLWKVPLILSKLSCYAVRLAMILFAIWIIYSGIKFILSRGNPEAYGQAKKNLIYALAGGLIVYGVYTIILTIAGLIGVSSLPWVPLSCP